MPLAYSLADVVVSASVEPEAFGRVSVESQSMGKPIIASNIGGSKETILNKKSGFLYKHDDPRELAKNLNTVMQLNQEELKLIGNEGRKVYTKKLHSLVERYSLTKKVKFIENCKEMPLAYSLADVVVSASIEPEAFGRVAVESQLSLIHI